MRNLIILFSLLIGFSVAGYAQKTLPKFGFEDLNGESFTYAQLVEGKPTIVVYFDPWCDHCADQADIIGKADDKFKDFNIVFVTNTDPDGEESKVFKARHFDSTKLENVFVLRDPNFYFDGYFGYSEVPSMYVFDADKKRVAAFTKEASAEEILAKLEG
ncbi:MAG: TlpA family protein disulfide reductase [Bacteroidia bacterium]